jgi:putative oxidoreductase
MIETLFFKFTAAPESVYIFSKMGTEPWMRWAQGVWELLASICLLWPHMKWAGGILTTGAMLAAILSHVTRLGYSIQGDHGLLFGMVLVTFTCGVTVMWLYRHPIPGYVPATMY